MILTLDDINWLTNSIACKTMSPMESKVFGDLLTCTLLDLISPNYGMNQQTKTYKDQNETQISEIWLMGSIVTMALWRDSAEVSSYQYPIDPYYCAYMVSVALSWMDENAWNQVLGLIVTAWIHIRLSTSRTIDTILLSCMMLTGFKIHRPPKIRSKFASNLLFVCETSIYKMMTWTHIVIISNH